MALNSKNKKILSNILGVGFFLLVGAVFVFIIREMNAMDKARLENIEARIAYQKKRTAETTGTITNYQEHQYIKHRSHAVTYDYAVNGKAYAQTNESPIGSYESHRKGVEGKVCYDPANPENAFFSLREENIICGE